MRLLSSIAFLCARRGFAGLAGREIVTVKVEHVWRLYASRAKQMRSDVGPPLLGASKVCVTEKPPPAASSGPTARSSHRPSTSRRSRGRSPARAGETVPVNVIGCRIVMLLGVAESEI